MLPECNQMMVRKPKEAYAPIDPFRVIRIKFTKTGNMQYISHLDMQRHISRVLSRAAIPMWYTKGFNPHAKVIFALPLSIGAQSECEYIDLRIDRDMSCEEIRDRLNAELTKEMQVLEAYVPDAKANFQQIAWADYDICIRCDGMDDALPAQIQAYFSASPVMVEKKTKSGMRQMDIVPLIRVLDCSLTEDAQGRRLLMIGATLSASSAEYLNPEQLVHVLHSRFSLLSGDPVSEEYSIFRRRVLLADRVTEFR